MAEVRRIHKIREAIPAKEGGSEEYPSIARTGEGKRRKRQERTRTYPMGASFFMGNLLLMAFPASGRERTVS